MFCKQRHFAISNQSALHCYVWGEYLSLCLSVCLSVCLFVCSDAATNYVYGKQLLAIFHQYLLQI